MLGLDGDHVGEMLLFASPAAASVLNTPVHALISAPVCVQCAGLPGANGYHRLPLLGTVIRVLH